MSGGGSLLVSTVDCVIAWSASALEPPHPVFRSSSGTPRSNNPSPPIGTARSTPARQGSFCSGGVGSTLGCPWTSARLDHRRGDEALWTGPARPCCSRLERRRSQRGRRRSLNKRERGARPDDAREDMRGLFVHGQGDRGDAVEMEGHVPVGAAHDAQRL